ACLPQRKFRARPGYRKPIRYDCAGSVHKYLRRYLSVIDIKRWHESRSCDTLHQALIREALVQQAGIIVDDRHADAVEAPRRGIDSFNAITLSSATVDQKTVGLGT